MYELKEMIENLNSDEYDTHNENKDNNYNLIWKLSFHTFFNFVEVFLVRFVKVSFFTSKNKKQKQKLGLTVIFLILNYNIMQ